MANDSVTQDDLVEISATDGKAFIDQTTPLTRLHYFDGKYLRADAFTLDQDYHRTRSRLANLAGGWGVVNGLGISIADKTPGLLQVSAGLAITAAGNFVLATGDLSAEIAGLLAVATPAPISGNPDFGDCLAPKTGVKQSSGLGLYEITVGPLQGLCGNEAVYGKLCEAACVSDSQHPYWREGVVLRLRPITLSLPDGDGYTLTPTHLRNRVASAYFASEPWLTPSSLSAAGLNSDLWCRPASLYNRDEVVIGLLVREGSATRVIDAWGGRRERMETQARGFWQGQMAMRPWNIFVAQVLQFQCQLAGLFDGSGSIVPPDGCDKLRELLGSTRKALESLHRKYSEGTQKILAQFGDKARKTDARQIAEEVKQSYARLYDVSEQLAKADLGQGALPINRLLLNSGFVELPPAGYLPLALNAAPMTVQLARIFGEGVRLHYHAVRHDEIAHLVEQAQHMDRISLTQGLKNAQLIEDVEVFLPDGKLRSSTASAISHWWQMDESTIVAWIFFLLTLPSPNTHQTSALAQDGAALERDGAHLERMQAMLRQHIDQQPAGAIGREAGSGGVFDGRLAGLARTDARPDGSFGLTLLGARAGTVSTEGGGIVLRHYLAFDLAQDLFLLNDGQGCEISLYSHWSRESSSATVAVTSDLKGAMTVTGKRTLPGGLTELSLAVALDGSATVYQSPPSGSTQTLQTLLVNYRADWKLTRQSGASGGSVATQIDIGDSGGTGLPAVVKWAVKPLAASLDILLPQGLGSQGLAMRALPAEPAPNSTLRKAAMQSIDDIAALAFDGAFALVAGHRLFDPAATHSDEAIVPMRDWVMFRRARTLLCDPDCRAQALSTDEATQVWHLRLDNPKQLPALRAALDKNDAKALAGFTFKPVGVLRYADDSAEPLDSDQDVHLMWQAADPAAQVALGRVWEKQPTTGQGWQNHFRLLNMLKTIDDLTKAPADIGKGVIQAIQRAPTPLADNTLDGGMLVVTMDQSVARKALLITGSPRTESENFYAKPIGELQFQDDKPQGTELPTFLAQAPVITGVVLATPQGPVDAGATARLNTVAQAVIDSKRASPNGLQNQTRVLSSADIAGLKSKSIDTTGYDDILIFEFVD